MTENLKSRLKLAAAFEVFAVMLALVNYFVQPGFDVAALAAAVIGLGIYLTGWVVYLADAAQVRWENEESKDDRHCHRSGGVRTRVRSGMDIRRRKE